jgi:polysaccharide deacetylase 2 family uncharacterized protein YibQ
VKYGGKSADIFPKNRCRLNSARGVFFAALCLLVWFGAPGCRRELGGRLTPAQVHQVTEELAKTASETAPSGSVIKVRRARSAGSVDDLYIGLRENAAAGSRLEQKLSGVATQHRLTVDTVSQAEGLRKITLRSAGVATHHIAIEFLAARAFESGPNQQPGQARLAIILDDLGNDRGAAEAIFALHVPITLSVLPYHGHSQEIAQQARARGCEVLLHLPMQSLGNEMPEREELRPGLSRDEVEAMVTKMLDALPEADGVNNHQGSQATANGALMNELMPVLKDAGVFYVDSRTTAATVAYDTARQDGVKTGFRNVPFLDDIANKEAVERQLQIAIRGARRKGEAIAIGHPHPATLAALREMLPEAKKQGVRLVFASDLVH